MTPEQRAARVAELWEQRHCDPTALIIAYRRVAGRTLTQPLPTGVTFATMIRAIVDTEAEQK